MTQERSSKHDVGTGEIENMLRSVEVTTKKSSHDNDTLGRTSSDPERSRPLYNNTAIEDENAVLGVTRKGQGSFDLCGNDAETPAARSEAADRRKTLTPVSDNNGTLKTSPGRKTSLFRKKGSPKTSPKMTAKFYTNNGNDKEISAAATESPRGTCPTKAFSSSTPPTSPEKITKKQKQTGEEKRVAGQTQTHIATFDFNPRHKDELVVKQGDPLYVSQVYDDLWLEAVNLVSGKAGVVPFRYAADILTGNPGDVSASGDVNEYFLRFLGTTEVSDFKGDEVLCYAIAKTVNQHSLLATSTPYACTIQITKHGIRITPMEDRMSTDQTTKDAKTKKITKTERMDVPNLSYFFAMKNVTFCGNHPRDRRYFAFITKHPNEARYACHVLASKFSTDQVARSFGTCFKQFHADYLAARDPTEDIYME